MRGHMKALRAPRCARMALLAGLLQAAIGLPTGGGADAAAATLPMAGEGGYDALMVTLAFDEALVTTLLPPGLSLAPQNLTAAGTHPMVFAFGNQSHVRPIAVHAFDVSYSEYIHSIPYVQHCGADGRCRGPMMFNPRLYLDKRLPVVLGWMYGLSKHLVATYESAAGRQAIGRASSPLIGVEWNVTGPFVAPAALPHFAPIAAILLAQPIVGWQPTAGGWFECSDFDWGVAARATVANAAGVIRVGDQYGPPFAAAQSLGFGGRALHGGQRHRPRGPRRGRDRQGVRDRVAVLPQQRRPVRPLRPLAGCQDRRHAAAPGPLDVRPPVARGRLDAHGHQRGLR